MRRGKCKALVENMLRMTGGVVLSKLRGRHHLRGNAEFFCQLLSSRPLFWENQTGCRLGYSRETAEKQRDPSWATRRQLGRREELKRDRRLRGCCSARKMAAQKPRMKRFRAFRQNTQPVGPVSDRLTALVTLDASPPSGVEHSMHMRAVVSPTPARTVVFVKRSRRS